MGPAMKAVTGTIRAVHKDQISSSTRRGTKMWS